MTDCRNEKQRIFEQQALAHTDQLRRFGMHLTGNAADADDLVQETFLRAYRFWEGFDQGTNIRAWLCRILKNSFINLYRKESREREIVDEYEMTSRECGPNILQESINVHEAMFDNLLDDDVSSAVSDLKDDYRTVLILCDIEGLSYEDIALFVGCPVGTVRSRIHRGRKLLQAKLYDYAKGHGYVQSESALGEGIQAA